MHHANDRSNQTGSLLILKDNTMNFNQSTFLFFIPKTLIVLALFLIQSSSLQAQDKETDLSISLGASVGYAPALIYGKKESSGGLVSVFGELQYQNIMGRLQFTSALVASFNSSSLEQGSALHGSLGYNVTINDQLKLPLLLTGGATFITYRIGLNGSSGDSFSDVSPQVGVTVAPYYEITDLVSIQAAFRYLKGFSAGDRSQAIDLTDIALGIRLSF